MSRIVNTRYGRTGVFGALCLAMLLAGPAVEARQEQAVPGQQTTEKVSNPVARLTGLDKITGRIITFDVMIDDTVPFGALRVTPRVCFTRPDDQARQTSSFMEVDEVMPDGNERRIFTGWMFASSPGLNAIEHSVYDVWLVDCKTRMDEPEPGSPIDDDVRGQEIEDLDDILIVPRPRPLGQGG